MGHILYYIIVKGQVFRIAYILVNFKLVETNVHVHVYAHCAIMRRLILVRF